MNIENSNEYIKGIFLYETKHRFMCMVMINGKEELCHTASSMKLEKIINLKGKQVLLTRNLHAGLRTKYTLLALIDTPKSLLNLSYANELVYIELIRTRKGQIHKEKYCNAYKTDLLINDKCIIEVKTILSDRKIVNYPCKDAERGKNQLLAIKKLLDSGYKVELWFIYLNNRVKEVSITEDNNYKSLLKDCLLAGVKIVERRVILDKYYGIKLQRLNKSIIKY